MVDESRLEGGMGDRRGYSLVAAVRVSGWDVLGVRCSVFGARCSVLTGDFVAAASVGALLYFFRVHLCLCLRHVPDLSSSQNKSRCGRGSERDARCMMHDV